MASKKQDGSLGCTLLIAGLFGLAFAVPYLFALAVYAFPVFLCFLLVFSRWGASPTIEQIDETQAAAANLDLRSKRDALKNEIIELRNRGAQEGIRFLAAENRFEMRSSRGQEFNRALVVARSSLDDVLSKIEMANHPTFRKDLAWQVRMGAWRNGRAFRLAFLAAILGFTATAVLLETLVYQGRQRDLLVWNVYPSLIGPHIEVGTIVGGVLGFTTLLIARRRNRRIEERRSASQQQPKEFDDVLGIGTDNQVETSPPNDPYQTLNISPEASAAEIKAAYRLAITKCHPDTVADRSKLIRNAAEDEAQRVNAAYDLIRQERGIA